MDRKGGPSLLLLLAAGLLVFGQGATVIIETEPGADVFWEGVHLGRTDEEGRMLVSRAPRRSFSVRVVKDTFKELSATLAVGDERQVIRLPLEPLPEPGEGESPSPPAVPATVAKGGEVAPTAGVPGEATKMPVYREPAVLPAVPPRSEARAAAPTGAPGSTGPAAGARQPLAPAGMDPALERPVPPEAAEVFLPDPFPGGGIHPLHLLVAAGLFAGALYSLARFRRSTAAPRPPPPPQLGEALETPLPSQKAVASDASQAGFLEKLRHRERHMEESARSGPRHRKKPAIDVTYREVRERDSEGEP